MSPLTQSAPDSPSPSGAALWHSPAVLALFLPGFAVSLLCGWSLTTSLKSGGSTSVKTSLGGGGLLLLHAQEEAHLARQREAASQSQDFTHLTKLVAGIREQLAAVDSQIRESEKKLKDLELAAGSATARKNAFLAEKQLLEQMLDAYAKADAERQKTEQIAMPPVLPGGTSIPSAKDLDAWKTEWQAMSADAVTKIKTARDSVQKLQQLKTEWEAGKDTFSDAQKTDMYDQLAKLQNTTESSLKAMRDAVAAVEKPLKDKIQTQGEQLAQIIKNAEK